MRKKIILASFLAINMLCAGTIQTFAQCEAQFIENDGLLVAEIEEVMIASGWIFRNDIAGHTGSGFFEWKGGDLFGAPGKGVMEFKIKINNPGTYQFKWRSKVGKGTDPKEHNDSWLKMPDAADFYGFKSSSSSTVRPKGVCTQGVDCPAGAGADGWFKIFLSGTTNWTWSTNTSDNDGHDIFAKFDTAGVYTVLISGRSNNHIIDRFVLYNPSTVSNEQATSLANESTMCPDFDYGLFTITINVKASSQKLANVDVKLGDETKQTNAEGVVVFNNLQRNFFDTVSIDVDIYEPYVEAINILGSFDKTITLVSKRYDVNFYVTDGANPVEGAIVKISALSSLTDANGKATIENLLPFNDIQYTISQNGFVQYTGTFNIVNTDVDLNVSLIPTSTRGYKVNELTVFPNPVTDVLYFQNGQYNTLEIYSNLGQLISSQLISGGSVYVGDLDSGLYFACFKNEISSDIIKFIKK